MNLLFLIFIYFNYLIFQIYCLNEAIHPTPTIQSKPKYNSTEEWYEHMPIDHFNKTDTRTFNLRYLINKKYVKKNNNNPPIFFYIGNNNYIYDDAEDMGFLWEIAPEFGAILIYVEHRFYGKSLPFGNESFSSVNYLKYLNTKQALEDYVLLINYIKNKRFKNTKYSPVISFGFATGGELAAWLRIKYPSSVIGAVASSALVHFYKNVSTNPRPDLAYSNIVTKLLLKSGCTLNSLNNSFELIRQKSKTPSGRQYLNDKFKFSNDSKIHSTDDGEFLIYNVMAIFDLMAKSNYPYSSSWLPALPVKEACKPFAHAKTDDEYILASYGVLNLYNNYTGDTKEMDLYDFSPSSKPNDTNPWEWQTCTEYIEPMCSLHGAPFDPFNKGNCYFNETEYLNNCLAVYSSIGYTKEMFDPYFVQNNYGYEWPNTSNIVFSNGDDDPWSAGRWRQKTTNEGTIYNLIIEDGAQMYDFKWSNKNDTEYVKDVRNKEKMHIGSWILQVEKENENN